MFDYLEALKKRRTIYGISDALPIEKTELEEMLGGIVTAMPTAYNMQSSRMVLLLGQNHKRLWEIVLETLRQVASGNKDFSRTEQKMASFAAGYGTILYFDDTAVTNRFAMENQSYSSNFPVWAQQQNAMLQHAVWTALAQKEIGASLQHYNPLIDDAVRQEWQLPESWKLIAEMPFGGIAAPAGEKEVLPVNQRFKVIE